ncbi:MAG: hypothetical protein N2558_02195 [Patescibacteria group bacterium]|nr:hypothetical protein [Patescibacteria group bacterium]
MFNINEPYWSAGLNLATANDDIRNLYAAMKRIAPDVPVFVYMDGIADLEKQNSSAKITNGMGDIIAVWLHCFGGAEGSCQDAIESVKNDRKILQERGINAQLFFSVQTFGGAPSGNYIMPTYSQLKNFTCEIISTGTLDGLIYYPWRNPAEYRQYLFNSPQLHGVIKDVKETCINNSLMSTSPIPSIYCTKAGDANCDNKVDGSDYVIWLNNYLQAKKGARYGDFDNNGLIDGIDYVIWLKNYQL